jgi:sulfane dehydrogenase subunit SoxC
VKSKNYDSTTTIAPLTGRRKFLGLGLSAAGLAVSQTAFADNQNLAIPPWALQPGPGPSPSGTPSTHTSHIRRLSPSAANPLLPGGGASRTPWEFMQGSITPNRLHFERHHAGIPAIDPARHQLVIHGMVRQPLVFNYEELLAYPMISRVYFVECAGNSAANTAANAPDSTAGGIHGLLSCAEWTGIRLSTLLEQAGVHADATWVSAVGADGASMGRSIPIAKALDDTMLALYQNGEPVRPEQGYPMRLVVPGWEGNICVKWLTQLHVSTQAAHFRDETSRYTDLLSDGRALKFTYPLGAKSIITSPSGQMHLKRQGAHEITGIAWSGHGSIRRVEISSDGGRNWRDAILQPSLGEKSVHRFSLAWQWDGSPAILQSRATDTAGNVQPSRQSWILRYHGNGRYHYNAIQSWSVSEQGEVRNVYA